MQLSEFMVSGAHRYDTASPARWFWAHVRRYPWLPVMIVLSTVGGAYAFSRTAVFVGQAFDLVLSKPQDTSNLIWLSLIIVALRAGQGLISMSRHFFTEGLSQRLQRDIRDELYLSLLGKSQTFHNRQRTGDIMARATNDVRQIGSMINPGFSQVFLAVVYLIVALSSMAFLHPYLLVTPLIFGILFPLALRRFSKQLSPIVADQRKQFGLLNAGLSEAISGVEVVKAYAQEDDEERRFDQNAQRYATLEQQQGMVQARYLPLLLLGIFYALGFGHAIYLWRSGILSVGQVITFMSLFDLLRLPTTLSLLSFTLMQLGIASAKRILSLINGETELDENTAGHAAAIQGAVTFDNVSFGYGDKPVLHSITLNIQPGQTVAVVGRTGSGKSSLTKLVNRTYDVNDGRLLIDSVDVREWSLEVLRSQISTIEQDVFLFSRTIADNIAFGARGKAEQAQIEEAARLAQAHDFIMQLPDGYNTLVGERGVKLSGGQRQRIAIARAFLVNPRILILDDSTSAIDSATEDQIQQAMRQVAEGRTTILITNRFSQIRWADHVVFLNNGHIVDQGTHDELVARESSYRRLFANYYRDTNLPVA